MDRTGYLAAGQANYALRAQAEGMADAVCEKGFQNIFFVGSGGSLMMLDSFRYIFFQKSDIPAYAMSAAEVVTCGSKQINERSLAVLLTLNGTSDIAQAAQALKARGATIVAFVGVEGCPVEQQADYVLCNKERDTPLRYLMLQFFCYKVLHNVGGFPEYPQFAQQIQALPEVFLSVREQFAEWGRSFGQTAARQGFILWLSSGAAYSECARYAGCTVEEMVRIKTQTVNSAEFFHGPFELVDRDLCVVLVKNVDGNRALEERAERFLERFSHNYYVLDFDKVDLKGIDRAFLPYLIAPLTTLVLKAEVQPHLEAVTGLSAATRKYYGVEQY